MAVAEILHRRIAAVLERRLQKSALRSLDPPPYDASQLVDFSSNDYLSLSRSPVLQNRLRNVLLGEGTSSSATSSTKTYYGPASSRLLDGNSSSHLELERRLARFFQGPSALLFNSGFDANAGVFACLPSPEDAIVYDEYIHASAHDGMRTSRTSTRIAFRHNSVQDLETQLQGLLKGPQGTGFQTGSSQVFVAVESLYSMDGDLAPIKQILQVVERLFPNGNGHLIVDEAHSTGLFGKNGRGLCHDLGVSDRILIRLHTFGKAMACSGGVVICSPVMRNYFINYARPLIYSTVMPHLMVSAISASLSHLEDGHADANITKLQSLANTCHDILSNAQLGKHVVYMPPQSSEESISGAGVRRSPIVPVLTSRPRQLSRYLIERGYLVRPIAAPTVPVGQERVRICLHANNTVAEVKGMVNAIEDWGKLAAVSVNAESILQARL